MQPDSIPEKPNTAESMSKNCRECGTLIPASARKCATCESYLDWRRFFFLGNSALSLLIALFAVLSLAVPKIKEAVTSKHENVTVKVLDYRYEESLKSDALVVLISNNGTAPAFVSPNALVFAGGRTKGSTVNLLPALSSNQMDFPASLRNLSDLLIEPSHQIVTFATQSERTPKPTQLGPNDVCEFQVDVFKLDGNSRKEIYKYNCFDWNTN